MTRELTIEADDGTKLVGTLQLPTSEPRATALLLSGSGPLDRDSNMPSQQLDVSSAIAEGLVDIGVASFRYDKRGVGESDGDHPTTGFHTEAADAVAALRAVGAEAEVDAERIGVIGHSVGATIAAHLAATDGTVAFAVLLACAAQPGSAVMTWQSEQIAASLPGPRWLLGTWFLRRQRRDFRRLDASTDDVISVQRSPQPARWMREYRSHDPLPDLQRIACPVLAVTGEKDIQVDPGDLEVIADAVSGPCRTSVPADLTHVLRRSRRRPSILHYSRLLVDPVDRQLMSEVTTWVDDVVT